MCTNFDHVSVLTLIALLPPNTSLPLHQFICGTCFISSCNLVRDPQLCAMNNGKSGMVIRNICLISVTRVNYSYCKKRSALQLVGDEQQVSVGKPQTNQINPETYTCWLAALRQDELLALAFPSHPHYSIIYDVLAESRAEYAK